MAATLDSYHWAPEDGSPFAEETTTYAANAAVARYVEARKKWNPRAPWIEIREGREIYCGEVWCNIAPALLARWAGEKEYDSWNPVPEVPAMATSGDSGQNVGADRPDASPTAMKEVGGMRVSATNDQQEIPTLRALDQTCPDCDQGRCDCGQCPNGVCLVCGGTGIFPFPE